MITVLWPDGKISTGKSWEDLEEAIRAAQWGPFKTKREFRREMRKRAFIWSGKKVEQHGTTSRAFVQALADRGMFMIDTLGGEDDE